MAALNLSSNDSDAVAFRTTESSGQKAPVKNSTWEASGVMSLTTQDSVVKPVDIYSSLLSVDQRLAAVEILNNIQYVLLAVAIVVTWINVVVFGQKAMRSAASLYLLGVSFFQLLYLLLPATGHLLRAVDGRDGYAYVFHMYFLVTYAGSALRRAALVAGCLLSAERLYAVARPLHVKESVLARCPLPLLAASFIASAAFHLYLPVKFRVVALPVSGPGGSGVYYTLARTDLCKANPEAFEAAGAAAKVIFAYVPLLLLCVVNALTIVCLKRHSTQRRQLHGVGDAARPGVERRELQMTVTVVVATVCFVLLSLPEAVHSIVISFVQEYTTKGLESSLYFVMENLGYACTLLSFATDFLSFASLSSTYRRALYRFFCLTTFLRHSMTSKNGMTSSLSTSVSEFQ